METAGCPVCLGVAFRGSCSQLAGVVRWRSAGDSVFHCQMSKNGYFASQCHTSPSVAILFLCSSHDGFVQYSWGDEAARMKSTHFRNAVYLVVYNRGRSADDVLSLSLSQARTNGHRVESGSVSPKLSV